ncbi:hypothetical protein EV361DRAFT_387945 [Lentinula raphanica]|uniref:F-box domain-containing protein n=1 Tax=Lentinula raphanica TaxID=153919 RepID=A0AA38P322_9AGAR|nr:hypothetical protein F5878DRAFT_311355 [Lentinula raphanica]KAJ3968856.1 hypothetical protein EV361DRAFT_387945 [Lentinula raphanica]
MNTSHTWDLSCSPFIESMGTNYAPSPDEILELKALLIQPYAELARLEAEIARALCEKEKISSFIEAHRALMSPVRQIPEEVLAEIFLHCLPTDRNFAIRSLDEAPLLLTTICRDWRRVALDTPRLWSTLHVYLPSHLSTQAISRRAAGISTWLGRSGTLPLSISFRAKLSYQEFPDEAPDDQWPPVLTDDVKSFICALTSFGHRFSDLFLSLPVPHLTLFDECSANCRFSSLHTFHVQDADFYHYPAGPIPGGDARLTSLLTRTTALRGLGISDGFCVDSGYLALPVDWELLTDLYLRHHDDLGLVPREVLRIIQRTPNLRNLHIRLTISQEHPLDSAAILNIMLPRLVNLRLEFARSSQNIHLESAIVRAQTSSIFRSFSVPSLKMLSIGTPSWARGSDTLVDLTSVYDGSRIPFHNLETLELALAITSDELTRCLSSSPELVSFKFENNQGIESLCFSESHLSALTPSHANPVPLCPKLSSIRLFYLPWKTNGIITASSIINFVLARATTLKLFDLFLRDYLSFTEDDLATLRKLKNDGLNMRLRIGRLFRPQDSPSFGLLPSEPLLTADRNQISSDNVDMHFIIDGTTEIIV